MLAVNFWFVNPCIKTKNTPPWKSSKSKTCACFLCVWGVFCMFFVCFSVGWFVCFKHGGKNKWEISHFFFSCFVIMCILCLVHLKLGLKLFLRYCRLFFYMSPSCCNTLDLSCWHWEDSRYKCCWCSSSPCSLMIDNVCMLGVLMKLCLHIA